MAKVVPIRRYWLEKIKFQASPVNIFSQTIAQLFWFSKAGKDLIQPLVWKRNLKTSKNNLAEKLIHPTFAVQF
jgi:hypothetical protein